MEFQKTINPLDITTDNKDLLKKRINKKKDLGINKEIKIERPIIAFSINHNIIA